MSLNADSDFGESYAEIVDRGSHWRWRNRWDWCRELEIVKRWKLWRSVMVAQLTELQLIACETFDGNPRSINGSEFLNASVMRLSDDVVSDFNILVFWVGAERQIRRRDQRKRFVDDNQASVVDHPNLQRNCRHQKRRNCTCLHSIGHLQRNLKCCIFLAFRVDDVSYSSIIDVVLCKRFCLSSVHFNHSIFAFGILEKWKYSVS